ncbi:MAG: 1-acyl-sn-glycerol-3-phosphate acyltransferase [Streptomycetaceae bacterium]|nr:1-acyl-sn-glycerol-3-phosphate acyltransferase [Streptomycetaceae bacterium]
MNLWRPQSACGPHCIPTGEARVGPVRYLLRLVGAACVVLFFIVAPKRPAVVRAGARALLAVLGLSLVVRGKPRPGLLVANHVSWVDIVILLAVDGGVRLVSKREVGGWPVIGSLARRQGAIFVDRSAPRRLPGTVAAAAAALRSGATVAVFPEATTTCGACPVPLRPAFFQAAIDAVVPVTPVSLRFSAAGERSAAAAFVGDETLLASVRRLARAKGLTVTVTAAAPLHPEVAADRRALARVASASIAAPRVTPVRLRTPVAAPVAAALLVP